jgi:hypothetical protein
VPPARAQGPTARTTGRAPPSVLQLSMSIAGFPATLSLFRPPYMYTYAAPKTAKGDGLPSAR